MLWSFVYYGIFKLFFNIYYTNSMLWFSEFCIRYIFNFIHYYYSFTTHIATPTTLPLGSEGVHRRGGGAGAARRAGPRRDPPAGNLCTTYPTRYGADKEAAILQVVLLQQCTTVARLYSHHSLFLHLWWLLGPSYQKRIEHLTLSESTTTSATSTCSSKVDPRRVRIARRAAKEFHDGMYINLGEYCTTITATHILLLLSLLLLTTIHIVLLLLLLLSPHIYYCSTCTATTTTTTITTYCLHS